jgi:hypothetical protein
MLGPSTLNLLARLLVLTVSALGLAACNGDAGKGPAGPAGPAETVLQGVELARNNDVAGLIEHNLPPAEFARVKATWNERSEPVSDAQRQRFADLMARLTAPDAATALYAEFEADIRQFDAQYQQQMPTIVAMGRGYLRGLVQQNPDLSAAEKEQANGVIAALAQWIEKTRFTEPEKAKQALAIASDTARQLDLKTLDQARALTFDESAPRLEIAFGGLKRLLEVYGLSIDTVLDSVSAEVISMEGDKASVRIAYKLLGSPLETRSEMVRIDGRWYSSDTIAKLDKLRAQRETSVPAAAGG